MATIRHTSIDELYTTMGAVILRATGRPWWRKKGVQARPKTPYATLYMNQVSGLENPITEVLSYLDDSSMPAGYAYEQIPWCTSLIDVEIEFYIDRSNDTTEQAARRFQASLFLEQRYWDLWQICSLAGRIVLQDLTTAFREDIEGRVNIRFQINANLVLPAPLADTFIHDIHSQEIGITHVRNDGLETDLTPETIIDDES